MKKQIFLLFFIAAALQSTARSKDSTINYNLPDSVKAYHFMAEIKITDLANAKRFTAGIQTNLGSVYFYEQKGRRGISFQMHEHSRIIATGAGVKNSRFGGFNYPYNWQTGKTYKLMVAMAADSADNICVYSAYVFLPHENKWKFIGTRRSPFLYLKLTQPAVFLRAHKKSQGNIIIGDVWCQRSNGSWRYMKENAPPPPVLNYFNHVDSISQHLVDEKLISDSIAAGKTDAVNSKDGIYYTILKEGTGRQVQVSDTVIAYYKGYLFSNGVVFDQTKDKPATFPLNRLIKGWQIGVPLCKVGGKIKLIIPSDLAYTIRTRAAKIPPNSILVFEIEVVDTKPVL